MKNIWRGAAAATAIFSAAGCGISEKNAMKRRVDCVRQPDEVGIVRFGPESDGKINVEANGAKAIVVVKAGQYALMGEPLESRVAGQLVALVGPAAVVAGEVSEDAIGLQDYHDPESAFTLVCLSALNTPPEGSN